MNSCLKKTRRNSKGTLGLFGTFDIIITWQLSQSLSQNFETLEEISVRDGQSNAQANATIGTGEAKEAFAGAQQ